LTLNSLGWLLERQLRRWEETFLLGLRRWNEVSFVGQMLPWRNGLKWRSCRNILLNHMLISDHLENLESLNCPALQHLWGIRITKSVL
jgi:hypothetical protein